MNIFTIQEKTFLNSFQKFVKSECGTARFYSRDSQDKDENDKEKSSRFNLTTGAVRENKDSAKEENFFYKQSLEQLKALKQKFFGNKTSNEGDSKKNDSN